MTGSEQEKFYKTSEHYTATLQSHDEEYFKPYLNKVRKYIPAGGTLLDLGCGTGYSSKLLADMGFKVTGVDLSEKFLDRKLESDRVTLVAADATKLPFADGSFDAVASYCFIEHVTYVPKVLDEMVRVTRKGGLIQILSPNLLSPFLGIKSLLGHFRGKRITGIYPPSVVGHLSRIFWQAYQVALKSVSKRPAFIYREPDLSGQWAPDSDSSYWCNQLDLKKYLNYGEGRINNEGYSLPGKFIARALPGLAGECSILYRRP